MTGARARVRVTSVWETLFALERRLGHDNGHDLGGRPVAALVYQRRRHTINVFVAPDRVTGVTPLEITSVRGFHVRHWSRDGMSFWAVSDLSDAELTEFARTLQGA
jgi:anti-sigma factor RsiW